MFTTKEEKSGKEFLTASYYLNPEFYSEIGLSTGEIPLVIGDQNENGSVDWQEATARILAEKNATIIGATAHYPIRGDELGRSMTPFLAKHFNGLILEQHYSWKQVEKEKGASPSDQRVREVKSLIKFASDYDMTLIGRPVFFSEHYPGWLKNGSFSKEQILGFVGKRLRDTVGLFPEISTWELSNELHDVKLGWHPDAMQIPGLRVNDLLFFLQKSNRN